MRRMLMLVLFELKKILGRKKALLFLAALNVVPLIASLALIAAFVKMRSFGFGEVQFSVMYEAVQALFTGHVKLFSFIAPFFLALIIGDSFSTEFNRGHMKMLLLTPVKRWQVITAKTVAVMLFLLLAVFIGGVFLQLDLFIARSLTQSSGMLPEVLKSELQQSFYLVTTSSALQLLFMTFVSNLMLIGYFVLFSLFFESAIIMSFTSLIGMMGIHTYYLIGSNFLHNIDKWYGDMAQWCFTRHISDLFSIELITSILNGEATLFSEAVRGGLISSLIWAAFFYALAVAIFSRKQILH